MINLSAKRGCNYYCLITFYDQFGDKKENDDVELNGADNSKC